MDVGPESGVPVSSHEHVHWFLVQVPSYGNPEKTLPDIRLRLARALQYDVKPGCTIQDVTWDEAQLAEYGDPWILDPDDKLIDMGDLNKELLP